MGDGLGGDFRHASLTEVDRAIGRSVDHRGATLLQPNLDALTLDAARIAESQTRHRVADSEPVRIAGQRIASQQSGLRLAALVRDVDAQLKGELAHDMGEARELQSMQSPETERRQRRQQVRSKVRETLTTIGADGLTPLESLLKRTEAGAILKSLFRQMSAMKGPPSEDALRAAHWAVAQALLKSGLAGAHAEWFTSDQNVAIQEVVEALGELCEDLACGAEARDGPGSGAVPQLSEDEWALEQTFNRVRRLYMADEAVEKMGDWVSMHYRRDGSRGTSPASIPMPLTRALDDQNEGSMAWSLKRHVRELAKEALHRWGNQVVAHAKLDPAAGVAQALDEIEFEVPQQLKQLLMQVMADGGADKADESARKLACPLVLLTGMRPALEEVARSDPDSAPVCQALVAELEALASQVEETPPGAAQGPFDALEVPFIKGLLAQLADPFSVAPVAAIQRDNKHSVSP